MSTNSPASSLTIPDFEPEDVAVADVFAGPAPRRLRHPRARAAISVGLNPAALTFVYLNIDPPGRAVIKRERLEGLRLAHSIWLDLRPAEALELASRLRTCAEAAARFEEAYPTAISGPVPTAHRRLDG